MLFRFTRVFVAIGLLGAVWLLVTMRRSDRRPPARSVSLAPTGPVKITQFYASMGALVKGEKAMLCYGVENARTVKIAPLEEAVSPSPNRCFEISPQHTTHYTIMAEGFDGKVATQSVTLAVNAAPPPPPRILQFAGSKQGGRMVKLCYQVANTEKVTVDPAVIPPTVAPVGCFGVEPVKTTTYTLTAIGSQQRKATKQVVVEVDPAGV
jgi:hypothetical protein